MPQPSARHAARTSMRLRRALRSFAESLESRLLLSTYTVTSAADSGPGTLRDAIGNSTADTVQFSLSGTITLSSQLEIARSLTISGPGAGLLSVSTNGASRVFQVDAAAVVEIDGITITGGHAPDGAAGATGAAQMPGGTGGPGGNGGGILNLGTLTLQNDAITANSAGSGGAGGLGGAGNSGGFNAGAGGAGGAGGGGGAIYSTGSLTLAADTLNANHAGPGGAGGNGGFADANGGTGGAGGSGGAILALGPLTMTNCTIVANTAGAGGTGGAGGDGAIGGNGAPGGAGGSGGGITVVGSALFTNDTIDGNRAAGGAAGGAGGAGTAAAGASGVGGGIFAASSSNCTMGNTIVAADSAPSSGPDVSAMVTSKGTNFIGIRDGSSGWVASDLTGTIASPLDPKLQPLGNFGGTTLTMPPLASSPAIDAGNDALITSPPFGGPPFTDQRGFSRIVSTVVDIGAIELQSIPLVVGTTSDTTAPPGQLTLRTAIAMANSSPGDHRITFEIPTSDPGYDRATGAFTITLGSTLELSNTSSQTIIQGPGAASLIVSGNDARRVFLVDPHVTAEIDGITITEGHAPDGPNGSAGTMPSGAGGAAVSGGDGGGVLNLGSLTLTDDIISNCAAGAGGAGGQGGQGGPGGSSGPPPNPPPVQGGPGGVGGRGGDGGNGGGIYSSGQLVLIRDTISGNHAGDGGAGGMGGAGGPPAGGLYPSLAGPGGRGGDGGISGGGGGTYCTGSLVLSNSTIAANFAGAGGAGGAGGTGGTFEQQYIDYIGGNGGNGGAGGDGAGIHADGSISISGDSIRQNHAGAGGDGGAAGVGTFPGLQPATHGLAAVGGGGGGLYLVGTSGIVIAQTSISQNVSGAPGTVAADVASGAQSGNGGGIFSTIPLTLNGDTIDGNSIPPASGTGTAGGNGGGIYEMRDLTSSRNSILSNAAGAGAPSGGPGGAGGGVFCAGQLQSTNDLIEGNAAGAGGLNSTGGAGGGIFYAAATQGRLQADTITRNLAGAGTAGQPSTGGTGSANGGPGGAGGNGGGVSSSGPLWLADDMIAGNAAGSGGVGGARQGSGFGGNGGAGGSGGGIYSTSSLTLTNCTISGNAAGAGGLGAFGGSGRGTNGAGGNGGGVCDTSTAAGATALGNTIVAANSAVGAGPDVSAAALHSNGFNLIGIGSGAAGWVASDQTGTAATPLDPKLAALGDYGGATPTIALLSGSPALDHGSNLLASNAGLTMDQRGLARVFNGTVDIGAYEAQAPALAGDVNHDGVVNFADLLMLAQHYGSTQPLFEAGDLNGDGSVSFADLLILAQNYGQSSADSAAAASLDLVRGRKRNHSR